MAKRTPSRSRNEIKTRPLKVWDLPTRMFHWLLVALVATSFITANIGGNAMQHHARSGYAILTLLLFRVIWGFVGSRTARFNDFIYGPAAVWRYAGQLPRRGMERHLGHNPLGGWSILAMLLVLMVQAVTGLFADDGILTQGPLYLWVGSDTSSSLTLLHILNKYLIAGLVCLHVAAVLFYLLVKGDNLITPMLTGIKHWKGKPGKSLRTASTGLALVLAALCAGAVYLLVR